MTELEATWIRVLEVWWSLVWRGVTAGIVASIAADFVLEFVGVQIPQNPRNLRSAFGQKRTW